MILIKVSKSISSTDLDDILSLMYNGIRCMITERHQALGSILPYPECSKHRQVFDISCSSLPVRDASTLK